jgi:hypothetical protein
MSNGTPNPPIPQIPPIPRQQTIRGPITSALKDGGPSPLVRTLRGFGWLQEQPRTAAAKASDEPAPQ